jgi:outer membrane lipase/esterase
VTGRANAWGSLSYDGQDYDSGGSSADFDGDSGAFTAGFDWLVAPQLVLGVVLDGSKGNYDGSGTDSDVDSFRGAVYGTWGGALGFYSDFLAGYGTHDLDSNIDPVGVLTESVSGSTDANSFQALWTAGYSMGDMRLKHGPFAGFEYQKVDVDGFTQGGSLPIEVGGFDVDSLRGLIGYRVDANLGMFRPYASLVYAHEFEDGDNDASASLFGNSFTVSAAEQSSAVLIGIGTGISLNEQLTLDVGYRGDIAVDDGLTSHGASLGVNYSF